MRFAVALVLVSALASAEEPPLGWKLQRGETLVYRLENTYKFWPVKRPDATPGAPADADRDRTGNGRFEEKIWMKLEVEDISGDGDATITVSFPRVVAHARMDDTGEEAEWDSKDGKPPAEFGFGPYEFLTKNTWKATMRVNGVIAGLVGKNDYLMAGKTKKRKTKGDMTRPEKASELMPMPLPIEFWLHEVFATLPEDGKSPRFKRRLTELLEFLDQYEGEFDSFRDIDGKRCAMHRLEKADRRIEEKKEGKSPADFSTGDFRDGDNVKTILASSRRTIRSWFDVKGGVMQKVEGEARDDRFKSGSVARSQDWSCVLESRKAAK